MSTIVTRTGKGAALTWAEADANFDNLNTDKLEINPALGTPVSGVLTNCTGLPAAGVSGTALVAAAIGSTVQAYDADTTKNDTANTFTAIQKWAKGADVASANALTLGTDGNYFDITGTTAITSIGTVGVGTVVRLHFDASLTLTHHSTDLVLPGGANITTAAGDEAELVEYATGDWRCTAYTRASAAVTTSGLTMATSKLLGRTTASTGAIEEITVGTGLTLSAGSLSSVGITLGTAVASTSGTAIDFTGIPAGTKRITIMFDGVSTNGTSKLLFQIGDSGGVESSGYSGASAFADGNQTGSNHSAGFLEESANAAGVRYGALTLTLMNAATFTWVASGIIGRSDTTGIIVIAGSKSLSAELDRVRITTANGTDAFDAGSINIAYES